MKIKDILHKVDKLKGCQVYPKNGQPKAELKLPDDVIEFYNLCGGVELFSYYKLIEKGKMKDTEHYPCIFVKPEEVVGATKALVGDSAYEEYKEDYDKQVYKDWVTIVDLYDGNYIVMDLNEKRLGRCYRAYWDTYALEGDMPVIAESFTELLEFLVNNKGGYFPFLEDDFSPYGDAFDGIDQDTNI